MNKIQIFEKLNENMQNLENTENEISMLQLAIYQKNIEKLKERKVNEIREFFEQQSIFYNQKSEKYEYEIEKNINKYKEQLEKLINAYNDLYVNIFKIMQNAMNNQKIAIANIVTLTERLQNEKFNDEEMQKIKNTIIACAQKKLNYAVIIDECNARIKWCIENVQADINEVFINNAYQLQIYEDNLFIKIKRIILNKISGKSKFKRFLENYENEYMKDIKTKNVLKVLNVVSTSKGIMKQMEEVKEQISIKYKKMIYT
jgi:uncharacterized protein YeaO (DUF488 family)